MTHLLYNNYKYFFKRYACMKVTSPNKATDKNAQRSPIACDKNPMMGGPIKKPKKPTDETEASAILAWPGAADFPTLP